MKTFSASKDNINKVTGQLKEWGKIFAYHIWGINIQYIKRTTTTKQNNLIQKWAKTLRFNVFFTFWPHHVACGTLIPSPWDELGPPAICVNI